jgi:hypothetical protein
MTTSIVSTSTTDVSDFTGGAESDVAMMLGIGLVKDSPAVFFQYLGDEQTPAGMTLPSGKPITSLKNITLSGISIAEDVGEFHSTKLNLFVTSSAGRTVMLTSGLTTIWSQCVLGGLMAMFNGYDLTTPFNLDSWYGTSKLRPVFAALKVNGSKVSDNDMYTSLADARADRDRALVEKICRDAVDVLRMSLGIETADIVIEDETSTKDVQPEDLF